MPVTQFDLKLANYVQDKGKVDFDSCIVLYGKSKSTLKRSLYRLNDYLPEHLRFSISDHEMKTNMTYADFSNLCKDLSLNDYAASIEERLSLIVCQAFLKGIVNMTELYQTIGLSLSTKKKDRQELGDVLSEKNVQIINCYRRGIQIEGNERFLRMYVARELISVIELNERERVVPRKANTPVQTMLYAMFEKFLSAHHKEVTQTLSMFFGEEGNPLDYASKKFIYIYTAISLMRIRKGHVIKTALTGMPRVPRFNLFPVKEDSDYMNYLMASLNFKRPLDFPEDKTVQQMTEEVISAVERDVPIRFYTYDMIYNELYAYLYKCLIKNKLDYYFYDDKLDDTRTVYEKLFALIEKKADEFDCRFGVELTEHQISVICLITERFIIKNRTVKENRTSIIIITNSSVEKVDFFLEALAQHVDFKMVSYLTINELYKLKHLSFDKIITFSNRITVLLHELGWESIKLNFYLTTEDIKKLLDKGFISSRSGKLRAKEVADELTAIQTKEETIAYLKERFPDYMI